jgi:hypothetical protein
MPQAAASAASAGSFFPLAIGNRWHLTGEDRVTVIPTGGTPPFEETIIDNDITRQLTGTETIFGRSYVVLREDLFETVDGGNPSATIASFVYYRQDASGLYEPDFITAPGVARNAGIGEVATQTAPRVLPQALRARIPAREALAYERAWDALQSKVSAIRAILSQGSPGGSAGSRSSDVLPNEITRLAYPLHPGAAWTIRTSPYFASVVEGVENLNLPAGRFAAYRIRIESEFFGEADRVHLWIGRSGQLRFAYHLDVAATDVDGNEIGRLLFDHNEEVDEVDLVNR